MVISSFKEWVRRWFATDFDGYEQDIATALESFFDLNRKYEALHELHVKRHRIGSLDIDPVTLTAVLRTIEPSMRAESDGKTMVIYSENPLNQAQINAVVARAKLEVNLT